MQTVAPVVYDYSSLAMLNGFELHRDYSYTYIVKIGNIAHLQVLLNPASGNPETFKHICKLPSEIALQKSGMTYVNVGDITYEIRLTHEADGTYLIWGELTETSLASVPTNYLSINVTFVCD